MKGLVGLFFVLLLAGTLTLIGEAQSARVQTQTSFVPASYNVGVNGSAYSLANGVTGQILEQSSNASQIFNDAYGNLTNGGTVDVFPGFYLLNGTICPTSNTVTCGAGESSVLSLSNTTSQPIMLLNNTQNVKILYLKLTHNFPIVWGSTNKTMNTYDIQALNTTNLEIAYCHVTQAADYAISIGCVPSPNSLQLPCYNTNIHDNLIDNSASDGLHYRGGSGHIIKNNIFNATGDDELGIAGLPSDTISDVTVEGNVFEDGNANAIKFTTEQGLTVANVTTNQITSIDIMANTIDTMNGGGIWIWVPQTSSNYTLGTVFCSDVSITGNIMKNTKLPAFLGEAGLTGCLLQDLTFSGNTISNCGNNGYGQWKDGSFFYSAIYSIISGNTFSRCGTSGYYSINFQDGRNDVISGNIIVNSMGYGMQDLNGSQNLFTGNNILFSFSHGFAVNNATDDLIENNYVEGSGEGALGDGIVYTGTNGTLLGNKIMGGGSHQRYALNIHLGSVNTVVSENDLRNVTTTSGAVNNDGNGTIFVDNYGIQDSQLLVQNVTVSGEITQTGKNSYHMDSGSSATFTANVQGGTLPYGYTWYVNGTANSSNQSMNFTAQQTGTYLISVNVTDSENPISQTSSQETIVTVPEYSVLLFALLWAAIPFVALARKKISTFSF